MRKTAPSSGGDPLPDGLSLDGSDSSALGEPTSGDDPKRGRGRPRSTTSIEGSSRQVSQPDPDSNSESVDQRISRSKWPKDKTKRRDAMTKVMPDYIRDYYGNPVAIARAMSCPTSEVEDIILGDPDLVRVLKTAEAEQEAILLDIISYNAIQNRKSVDAKWILERKNPDRYAKKSAGAPVRKPKSAEPPAPDEMESVLGPAKNPIKEN